MGAVYRALDTLLGRPVALKTILSDASEMLSGLRFLREAEVLAKLEHPHIVRIFDVGMQQRTSFIILEYLSGQSLRQLLQTEGKLDVRRALDLLLPVMAAVDYAHHMGVLHLDLKPTNLFIAKDHKQRPFPRVLDFGVCQLVEVDADLDPTRDESAGTPDYMAPETLSQAVASAASDQFALGCILHECLTGAGPFRRGNSLRELIALKQAGVFPRLRHALPEIPEGLCRAVSRSMQADPSARFASVREFGRAVSESASDEQRGRFEEAFA
jgi:serine/threonine-protein kinase